MFFKQTKVNVWGVSRIQWHSVSIDQDDHIGPCSVRAITSGGTNNPLELVMDAF